MGGVNFRNLAVPSRFDFVHDQHLHRFVQLVEFSYLLSFPRSLEWKLL